MVRKALRTTFYFIQSAMTGFIASEFLSRNRVSLKEAFEGLEPDEGKLSRPVLRGLAPSNGGRLLGKPTLKHEKGFICGRHFGALVCFAISGTSNAGSARSASYSLRGPQDGACTIASPLCRVGQKVLKTAFYFIQNAMTRFTASVFPYQSRVSSKEAFEGPEPCDRETITHGS